MEKEFSPTFTRRIDLLDKLIDTYLPNSYPCDYSDQWWYVSGVADEIFYVLQDDDFLNTGSGFSRKNPKWSNLYEEIYDYITINKREELIEYWKLNCIKLNKNYGM